MTRLEVDPDITRAETLDKAFYLDPVLWERTRERVFARSWQWLGALDDVAAPGSLSPRWLLPGLLDEPLLLARDAAGTLRCLSNVCTHRGKLLVQTAGPATGIRCGYHSRRFDLAGRMTFMPGFERACDFPSARDDLPALPFDTLLGHGYVALAPAAPLRELFGGIEPHLAGVPTTGLRADPQRSRDYVFDAHWALYVENYLEGLHIPFVHPGLSRALDLDHYRYEIGRAWSVQVARAQDDEPAFERPAGAAGAPGERIAAVYLWLFPNLMLNFYPWGLSLNLVQPLGPAKTRVLFRSFVAEPSLIGTGAGAALDEVELEDEAVVLEVQAGLRSRLVSRGRYSPPHERGVHHFHRLLAEFLAD
jgi:choline monooxygenase